MCQDSRPAGYGEIDLAQGADTESVRVGRADQAGRGGSGGGQEDGVPDGLTPA